MDGSKCHIHTKTQQQSRLSTDRRPVSLLGTMGKLMEEHSKDKSVQHYHATFLKKSSFSYQDEIRE
jgi:hypothetical protein